MPRKKPNPDSLHSMVECDQMIRELFEIVFGCDFSGPLSLRPEGMKRRGRDESYALELTAHQRESLICCVRIKNAIKERLKNAGEGTQTVAFTRKELDRLLDELESAEYAPHPHKKRLQAVYQKVIEVLASDRSGFPEEETRKPRKSVPKKDGRLFQFKITLIGAKPPIWRRIQVEDCTLDAFHRHIQAAMGWSNSHLYQFEIQGKLYGEPDVLDCGYENSALLDSRETLLSDVLPARGKRFAFKYQYDFGDDWEHKVVWEGNPDADPATKYPLCVAGERACPPEDCGGVWGYDRFLEAIEDPNDEEHEVMLEWVGGRFDPEEFDPTAATKAMREL